MMRAPDELFRTEIAQGTVRPNGIVIEPPGFDQLFGFFQIAEPVLVQAFVPQPAVLKLSMYAFWTGLPGWMKCSCTPLR